MNKSLPLSSSLEDYLETIFNLIAQKKVARSKDIADALGVKRPTVTGALKALADKGFIYYEPHSFVTLTQQGEQIARCVNERHKVLRELFTDILSLPAKDAEDAACSMEHGMNKAVCRALKSLVAGFKKNKDLARAVSDTLKDEITRLDCSTSCYTMPEIKEDSMISTVKETLNNLKSGETATIEKITDSGSLKKRLIELGVTAGQKIHMIKSAPLDDPIEVKIRNFNLSLRREEAENIIVQK